MRSNCIDYYIDAANLSQMILIVKEHNLANLKIITMMVRKSHNAPVPMDIYWVVVLEVIGMHLMDHILD